MSRIKFEEYGDKLVAGGVLSQQQKEALGTVTPTADDILQNLDEYNKRIEEINSSSGSIEPKTLPKIDIPKAKSPVRTKRRKNIQKKFDALNRVQPPKPKETEIPMNLDQEIDQLSKELDEVIEDQAEEGVETNTQQTNPYDMPDMKSQIMDLLSNHPEAPSKRQIEQWKLQHGQSNVNVIAFGEEDVYIFTHLKRGQWQKIQELIAKAAEIGNADAENKLREKVIQHCILWPSLTLEFFYNSKAGVIDSLYQVILLNSYFLTPQQAMLLTTQL